MQASPTQPTPSHLGSPWVWLSLLISSATLFAMLASWWWPFELLTNFRVQYIWLLLPIVLMLIVRKHHIVAAIAGACLVWNGLLVVPVYFGAPAEGGEPQLRLMAANVLTDNRNYRLLLDAVNEAKPDVLIVMEVDDAWQRALKDLRADYPYGEWMPRPDNFGIALLSKLPLESCEVAQLGGTGVPSIEAVLRVADESVTIIGSHPLPPMGRWAAVRNVQLAAVAKRVSQLNGPVIVAGDLNVTPWSPYFTRLLREGKLHDSRRGFGVHATWPGDCGRAGIPIDHVLVSQHVSVIDRRVGVDVGSDHRPVIVDLMIRPTGGAFGD